MLSWISLFSISSLRYSGRKIKKQISNYYNDTQVMKNFFENKNVKSCQLVIDSSSDKYVTFLWQSNDFQKDQKKC